jgi:hypothetical protein
VHQREEGEREGKRGGGREEEEREGEGGREGGERERGRGREVEGEVEEVRLTEGYRPLM